MQYDPGMYAAVNGTLYRYFAIVGGAYQLGSIVAAGILAYLTRARRRSFAWTLAGAVCLLLAFVAWLVIVAPVNAAVTHALQTAPASGPGAWTGLRSRWEYGHAAGFVLQLVGFGALVISVLVETARPDRSPPVARGGDPERAAPPWLR